MRAISDIHSDNNRIVNLADYRISSRNSNYTSKICRSFISMMPNKVIYLSELKYRSEQRGLKTWYVLETPIEYFSERYGKKVIVPEGRESDGATGALDIHSRAWWIHDELCTTGTWEDGTPVTNWQASSVLADVLRLESRPGRSVYWWIATWLFGCPMARQHGNWPWSKG